MTQAKDGISLQDLQGDKLSDELRQRLRSRIENKCKEFGIEIIDEGPSPFDDYPCFRINLKSGRETRAVSVIGDLTLYNLAYSDFEKYSFIPEYEAIVNFAGDEIECAVRPALNVSPSTTRQVLFPSSSEDTSEEDMKIVLRNGSSIGSIELSVATKRFLIFSPFHPPKKLTLKIRGFGKATTDEAISCLRTLSDSLFFQIEQVVGFPLILERLRNRDGSLRRVRVAGSSVDDVVFPIMQYDDAPMSLYWYAISATGMPLLQFLAFYQCVEYYFPRYSKQEAHRTVRTILRDPTFRPTKDSDINRILTAIQLTKSGAFGDEKSQLKAAIKECITGEDIRSFIFDDERRSEFFMAKQQSGFHRLNLQSQAIDIRDEVGERIYDIRCRIVHTKGEYQGDIKEMLLPFSKEASQLYHDIELVKYVAKCMLVSASSALEV